MARYQHQIRPAPTTMRPGDDLPGLPITGSHEVKGFLSARHGKLRLSHLLNDLDATKLSGIGQQVIGTAWYNDAHAVTQADVNAGIQRRSRLIVWYADYTIKAFNIFLGGRWPYGRADLMWTAQDIRVGPERGYSPNDASSEFRTVRAVQLGDEMFWCRSDGSRVRRMWQDANGQMHLHWCGIETPTSANVELYADNYMNGGLLFTTLQDYGFYYEYAVTFADEKFRESSPLLPIYHGYNRRTNLNAMKVQVLWPSDPQVKYAYVYRKAQGTEDYYRIGMTSTNTGQPIEYITRSTNAKWDGGWDLTAEADLVTALVTAPQAGQNDPPYQASMLAVHANRLWMDNRNYGAYGSNNQPDWTDYQSQTTIQISNLRNPTQYNLVPDLTLAELGMQMDIGDDYGDRITGLLGMGTLMGVWKQRSRYLVYGDSPVDYNVRYVDGRGCMAPDTVRRVDNAVYWLSDDGIYAMGYGDGFNAQCVSDDVDAMFTGYVAGSVLKDGTVED